MTPPVLGQEMCDDYHHKLIPIPAKTLQTDLASPTPKYSALVSLWQPFPLHVVEKEVGVEEILFQ